MRTAELPVDPKNAGFRFWFPLEEPFSSPRILLTNSLVGTTELVKVRDVKHQQRPGFPMTSEGAEAQIAHKLRSFYLSVQEEPIPQKFLDLLEKLDIAEQRERGGVGQLDRQHNIQVGSDDR